MPAYPQAASFWPSPHAGSLTSLPPRGLRIPHIFPVYFASALACRHPNTDSSTIRLLFLQPYSRRVFLSSSPMPFDSPYMKSAYKNGKVELQFGGERRRLDFTDAPKGK